MLKAKTSKKLKPFSKNTLTSYKFNAKLFSDKKAIKEILVEAIASGDIETFRDVLIGYIKAQSATDLAHKTGIGRQTIYDMLKKPKDFDPQMSTVARILAALAA